MSAMESGKDFKKSYCVVSVIYMIFGLVLLVWPDLSLQTLCYVLGAMFIVFGLTHIVLYFIKDRMNAFLQMDLVSGVFGIAAGIFVLVKPRLVIELLPFLAGVLMILGSVIKLQNALDLKRLTFGKWYLGLAAAAVMLLMGVILVVNPFETMRVIVVLMGAGMLVDGAVNIFHMIMINHMVRKMRKAMDEEYQIADERSFGKRQ